MDSWHLTHICDYWDTNTNAIERFSKSLRRIKETKERAQVVKAIAQAVEKHVGLLPDDLLVWAAVSLADNLYKTADRAKWIDEAVGTYIAAACGTFLQLTANRGYRIHYLVDLAYEMTEAGTIRPVDFFPLWFPNAGLAYICPQAVAKALMESDGIERAKYFESLPRYIDEARDLTSKLVARCHVEKRHYVYLDAASVMGTFSQASSREGFTGVVTVFRDTAATIGSSIAVRLPDDYLGALPMSPKRY